MRNELLQTIYFLRQHRSAELNSSIASGAFQLSASKLLINPPRSVLKITFENIEENFILQWGEIFPLLTQLALSYIYANFPCSHVLIEIHLGWGIPYVKNESKMLYEEIWGNELSWVCIENCLKGNVLFFYDAISSEKQISANNAAK